MKEKPVLSIVTPTRGDFSGYWIEQLLKVKGGVEFIIIYPPGVNIKPIADSRVKTIISPLGGEVMQRLTGLANAIGDYVLALDDDDFIHPHILELTLEYFKRFPNSWFLSPALEVIDYLDEKCIHQDWPILPNLNLLEVFPMNLSAHPPEMPSGKEWLVEVPIAPMDERLDIKSLIFPKGHKRGVPLHYTNFNNKVWKNQVVQKAIPDLSNTMKIIGALAWVPSFTLDSILSLFIQAKFFQKGVVVGHRLTKSAQIRFIYRPPHLKERRFHFFGDVLLLKRFPKYDYLWNYCLNELYEILVRAFRALLRRGKLVLGVKP